MSFSSSAIRWLLALLSAALLGQSFPGQAASGSATDGVQATRGSDGVQRADIVGGDYFFQPARIVVRVGVPVELSVRVEAGIVPHSFVLEAPAAGISIDEDLGEEPKVLAFVPRLAGSYPFHCRNKLLFFKSHRERGMEGVLEVVE